MKNNCVEVLTSLYIMKKELINIIDYINNKLLYCNLIDTIEQYITDNKVDYYFIYQAMLKAAYTGLDFDKVKNIVEERMN